MRTLPIRERLLRRSNRLPNGCLLWTGPKDRRGYGKMTVEKQTKIVHRVSYEEFVGPIPSGLYVCHHCDTPLCFEPTHLFPGSPTENYQDCVNKGRWRYVAQPKGTIHPNQIVMRGEDNASAKLTPEIVLRIRAGEQGWAKKAGISYETIRKIRRRESWKHLP